MSQSTPSPDTLLDRLGRLLAGKLQAQTSGYEPYTPSDPETLGRTLQPGDVLLVEGNHRISTAIKYLTQSTWSHAAFFIGDALDPAGTAGDTMPQLIEVDLGQGCIAVPLSKYTTYNTRICRPVGLAPRDRAAIVAFMISKIGLRYDMKNIFDLLRYFIPTPPVPVRWRRRMIGFGSGDPTKAICSTLIAQAFQSVGYPILPEIVQVAGQAVAKSEFSRREIMQIRHFSLFTPRDFDLSPYFLVVKPTLEYGFDYKRIEWREQNASLASDAD